MKIFKIVLLAWLVSFSSISAAAIITTDLAANTYITNNGLDWTWAGPVASTSFGSNELKAPSFHSGWRYATTAELSYLDNILNLFYDANNNNAPIHSAQYWNTYYTHVDQSNWNAGEIGSGPGYGANWYETVYVRDVSAVPVPAAAFMFAPALLGFIGLRRKAKDAVA